MIVIFLTGCRSKKVVSYVGSESEIIQHTNFQKGEIKVEKAENKQQSERSEILEQKRENKTEFEIKGKSETGKPIEIYNIENGDTLQAIRVNGNADVHIRTKAVQSDHARKEHMTESFMGKFKEFSEKIVEENNIKERIQQAKQKTKDIKSTGLQAGTWIVLAILGIVSIVIFAYKYFKK